MSTVTLKAVVIVFSAVQLLAQTASYRPPRIAGHPDLNGIWQALNEANYDIEGHDARPAMATRPGPYGPVPASAVLALGAVGSVPPGLGVVEGGRFLINPKRLPNAMRTGKTG